MKKFIGKPYAGKPHVRIDEGEKRQRRFSLLYREMPYDGPETSDRTNQFIEINVRFLGVPAMKTGEMFFVKYHFVCYI